MDERLSLYRPEPNTVSGKPGRNKAPFLVDSNVRRMPPGKLRRDRAGNIVEGDDGTIIDIGQAETLSSAEYGESVSNAFTELSSLLESAVKKNLIKFGEEKADIAKLQKSLGLFRRHLESIPQDQGSALAAELQEAVTTLDREILAVSGANPYRDRNKKRNEPTSPALLQVIEDIWKIGRKVYNTSKSFKETKKTSQAPEVIPQPEPDEIVPEPETTGLLDSEPETIDEPVIPDVIPNADMLAEDGAEPELEPVPEPEVLPEPPAIPEISPELPPEEPETPPEPVGAGGLVLRRGPEVITLTSVDASDLVDFYARIEADKELTKLLNKARWYKKWYYTATEEGYRQKFIKKHREIISNSGVLEKGMSLRDENDATRLKLLESFQKDYYRREADEYKWDLEVQDPEIYQEISDLVIAYAEQDRLDAAGNRRNEVTDLEFKIKRNKIIAKLKQARPELALGADVLNIDNFLQQAKNLRDMYRAGELNAELDFKLQIELGIAKRKVSTRANENWLDKRISQMSQHKYAKNLGVLVDPTTLGFAVSLGNYLINKPAYWLGGAVGAGALAGGLRRNRQLNMDLAMHGAERALGAEVEDYTPRKGDQIAKRREKMENYIQEMQGSGEMRQALANARRAFENNPSPDTARTFAECIADAKARIEVSNRLQIDLISYKPGQLMEEAARRAAAATGHSSLLEGLDLDSEVNAAFEFFRGQRNTFGIDVHALQTTAENSFREAVKSKHTDFLWYKTAEITKAALLGAAISVTVHELVEIGLEAATTAAEKLSYWFTFDNFSGNPVDNHIETATLIGGLVTGKFSVPAGTHLESYGGHSDVYSMFALKDSKGQVLIDKITLNNSNGEVVFGGDLKTAAQFDLVKPEITASRMNYEQHTGEWLDQLKGRGTEVVDVKRVGWYDGHVPGVKANAGLFFDNFDSDGNLHLDISQMHTGGSTHGALKPNLDQLLSEGRLKILLTPDGASKSQAISLDVDPTTHQAIVPKDAPWLKQLFAPGKDGKPHFLGRYMEVAEDTGGGKYRILSTATGKGRSVFTEATETKELLYRFLQKPPQAKSADWWVPYVTGFRRKELEAVKDAEDTQNQNRPTPRQGEPGAEFTGPTTRAPRRGDLGVAARGSFFEPVVKTVVNETGATEQQEVERDRENLGTEFPSVFDWSNSEDVLAERVFDSQFTSYPYRIKEADKRVLNGLNYNEQIAFFKEQILEERAEIKKREKVFTKALKSAYQRAEKNLTKYLPEGVLPSFPDPEKVHLLGYYESQAQGQSNLKGAGMFFGRTGEIFVDWDDVREITDKSELADRLVHTIVHELTHSASVLNWWQTDRGGPKDYALRRVGIETTALRNPSSRPDSGPMHLDVNFPDPGPLVTKNLINRGSWLNEAVTEELAREAMGANKKVFGKTLTNNVYSQERAVLYKLEKDLDIDFSLFARAALDRRALTDLVRAVDGNVVEEARDGSTKIITERPGFYPLIVSVMEYEARGSNPIGFTSGTDYPLTRTLIANEVARRKGKKITPINLALNPGLVDYLPDRFSIRMKTSMQPDGSLDRSQEFSETAKELWERYALEPIPAVTTLPKPKAKARAVGA